MTRSCSHSEEGNFDTKLERSCASMCAYARSETLAMPVSSRACWSCSARTPRMCKGRLARQAWPRASRSIISASLSKRWLCGPCPTEADICRRRCKVDVFLFRVSARATPVLMRACVHAEMQIGARGRAEGTCSGGSGPGAQPLRAVERCGRLLPASAAVILRWMWRLEKV